MRGRNEDQLSGSELLGLVVQCLLMSIVVFAFLAWLIGWKWAVTLFVVTAFVTVCVVGWGSAKQ